VNSTFRPDTSGAPCLTVTTCTAINPSSSATFSASGEFETRAPTISSNRQCRASTQCTLPAEFIVGNMTATTDRRCGRHPTQCPLGHEYTAAPELYAERQCQPCLVNSTFRPDTSGAPCLTVTTCTAADQSSIEAYATTGTFQSAPPTISSNRICSPSTPCTLNTPTYVGAQYIEANITPTSDRRCRAHPNSCPSCGQEWTTLPTLYSRRICRDCVEGVTFWNRGLGDNELDYSCRSVRQPCAFGFSETRAPTRCRDRRCSQNRCSIGEFVAQQPTENTTLECGRCMVNNESCGDPYAAGFTDSWAMLPEVAACHLCDVALPTCGFQPTQDAAVERCTPFQICMPGEYVVTPGTASADRQCRECPFGTWQPTAVTIGPVLDSGIPGCPAWQFCQAGHYFVNGTGNSTHDRQCQRCPSGTFQAESNHIHVECVNKTDCTALGLGTVSATDDAGLDNVCENCSFPLFFNASAEACNICSSCDPNFEVEAVPCHGATDTVCHALEVCNPPTTYMAVPGTLSSQTVCLPCSSCWVNPQDVAILMSSSPNEEEFRRRLSWVDHFVAIASSSSAPGVAVRFAIVSSVSVDDIFYFDFDDFLFDRPTLRRHVANLQFRADVGPQQANESAGSAVALLTKSAQYLFDPELTPRTGFRNFSVPLTVVDLTQNPAVETSFRSASFASALPFALDVDQVNFVRVELNISRSQPENDVLLAHSTAHLICRDLPESGVTCPTGFYQATPCTATSDRACIAVTQCMPPSEAVVLETPTSDRICSAAEVADGGMEPRPWPWWLWLFLVLAALLVLALCCCCAGGFLGRRGSAYFHPQSHEVVMAPTAKLAQRRKDGQSWRYITPADSSESRQGPSSGVAAETTVVNPALGNNSKRHAPRQTPLSI